MDHEELDHILRSIADHDRSESERLALPTARSAECPAILRLREGANTNRWTEEERRHLAACRSCRLLAEQFPGSCWHPTPDQLLSHLAGGLDGDERVEVAWHLDEDRCPDCLKIVKSSGFRIRLAMKKTAQSLTGQTTPVPGRAVNVLVIADDPDALAHILAALQSAMAGAASVLLGAQSLQPSAATARDADGETGMETTVIKITLESPDAVQALARALIAAEEPGVDFELINPVSGERARLWESDDEDRARQVIRRLLASK